MRELWIDLKIRRERRMALVLDASESAQDHQSEILQFASELLGVMPEDHASGIYFLGNDQPYSADDLRQRSEEMFRANRRRCSLLGPIFEGMDRGDTCMVVVLSSGRIFDVEDWMDTPQLDRTTFVRFGESALTNSSCEEIEPLMDLLKPRLYNPMQRVELSSAGVMPFFWDNPYYRWQDGRLIAQDAMDFSIHVGLFCHESAEIRVVGTLSDGSDMPIDWAKSEPLLTDEEGWGALSESSAKTLGQCITEGRYVCPNPMCGATIDATREVRCCKPGLFGGLTRVDGAVTRLPIYPELIEVEGFVLLRRTGDQGVYRCCQSQVLKLGPERVAVRVDGGIAIYAFDGRLNKWQDSGEEWRQHRPVGEGTYVIAL